MTRCVYVVLILRTCESMTHLIQWKLALVSLVIFIYYIKSYSRHNKEN